jgi:hypothetical protein
MHDGLVVPGQIFVEIRPARKCPALKRNLLGDTFSER